MKAKLILLVIGFVMGAALVRVVRRPLERRYFKGSNLSLGRQGLPVPYSDAVLASMSPV
jgi:hypothetical protein